MPTISINGITFDPDSQERQFAAKGLYAKDAQNTNHILLQTDGPLSKEADAQLESLGVVIEEKVSPLTYLAEYKPSDLQAVRELPFVSWANVYNKKFKVQASLRTPDKPDNVNIIDSEDVHDDTHEHNVEIIFFKSVTVDDGEINQVAERAQIPRDSIRVTGHKLRATVQHQYLDELAAIDGVKAIQEVHKMTMFNNKARGVLACDPTLDTGIVFQGEGQVVCVADTGLDMGKTDDILPCFEDRVKKLWALGRQDLCDDPHGHGTHVAGSVLGNGRSERLGDDNRIIQGTAPKANLVLQSLASLEAGGAIGLGGIPDDLADLFKTPYDEGARVHTNSWGPTSSALPYGQAFQIDKFIWENQDQVVCFAAGNEGVDRRPADGVIDAKQIGLYASAKNSITVGASENNRPEVETTYGQYGYNQRPLKDDKTSNNPEGMAAFSNRGYTPKDGRVKPDVVAPGTSILSAASRHPQARDGPPLADPDWRYMDGTSMATPLAAGCCAAIREAFIKQAKLETVPAALVKAALINGAVEMKGQYTAAKTDTGPTPNPNCGWGRVNLTKAVAIACGAPTSGFQIGEPLDKGEEWTGTIEIPKSGKSTNSRFDGVGARNGEENPGQAPIAPTPASGATFKITLVWTDPPGDVLQNDLDLIVIGSDGTEYHGNKGKTTEDFDRNNNVERIVWENMPPGEANITVRAYDITKFPQPWAFAWSVSQ